MITENSNGYSAHNKKIGDVAYGVGTNDIMPRGQFEDGTFSPTFDDVTVNGTLTATALSTDSVAPAITAKAGGGQDATLALSKNLNIVTTVATAADSVTLPSAAVGLRITIVNLGANALAVFPYTSDSINDEVADASVTVQPESTVEFNCYTTTLWESNNEAVDVFDALYVTGMIRQGTTGVITAFATGGQASATALTKGINNVSTCATAGDSVKLPSAEQGMYVVVKNSGAAALDIFPASSDSIDALAVNLAVRIQPSSTAIFFAKSTTVWESNVDASFTLSAPSTLKGQLEFLAADSAGNTVTRITNASQAAARTYTIPDAGASASFAMTEGAQTINGAQTYGGLNIEKAATSLTALAGGAQAGTAITSQYNNFTVVATTADSAQLPVAVLGKKIVVRNSAAIAMAVFGQTGDSIDGGSANVSLLIGPKQEVTFEAISGTAWQTDEGSSAQAGSLVTQATSTTTGVTINSKRGIITTYVTTDLAGLAACTFVVTNSAVTATSNIRVYIVDYAGTIVTNGVPIVVGADARGAGSFSIIYYNAHATNALAGQLQLGFEIIN